MGFFSNFWSFLQSNVLATVSQITSDIATAIEPAAITFATLYVTFWGILNITGHIREPVIDGAKRILTLIVILGVALHLWSYNDVLVDFFVNSPQSLSGAILSGNTAISTIDGIWVNGASVADALLDQGGLFTDVGFYIAGFVVYLIVGLVTIWTAYLYSLSIVGVGVLLAIGPIFVLGLMFDTTKRFFEAWIAQLSNYALIIIIAAIASKLLLAVLDTYVVNAQKLGAAVTTAEAMQLCLACGFILLIMRQVPVIAAGLASGIALSTYNALSGAINWAAGGSGRTLYQFGRGMHDGISGLKRSPYMPITRNLGNRAGSAAAKLIPRKQAMGGSIGRY